MVSPRSQIEMFHVSSEPRIRSFMSSCERARKRAVSDNDSIQLHRNYGLSLESTGSSIGLNTGLHQEVFSPEKFEINPALMTPDEWSLIYNNALTISSHFQALAEEETAMIHDNWYAPNFDLRTSHCFWKTSTLDLPELDTSADGDGEFSFTAFFNSQASSEPGNLALNVDMDDSLPAAPQRNVSYTVARDSATNDAPANKNSVLALSQAVSTPVRKDAPMPGAVSASPVSRVSPLRAAVLRSPSPGYGRRTASPVAKGSAAVARKATGAVAKTMLPKPTRKPVLAIRNANVRAGRKAPSQSSHVPQAALRGKENRL